jgi:hypothetical protein
MKRVLAMVVAIGIGIVIVVALRDTSMTVHTPMPRESKLVVHASASWRGHSRTAPNLSRALAIQCVAETSGAVTVQDFEWEVDGDFTFETVPSLDEADRRQLRGCLGDLRMPTLIVSVTGMQSIVPPGFDADT